MTTTQSESGSANRWATLPPWRRAASFAAVAITVLLVGFACANFISDSSESASSACRQLASDRYGGDNRFTEVTFTDGDFVKGRIGSYVGGSERTHAYWECSTANGRPEITFYSQAG